ncbi:hypothetical protein K438DRAFT_1778311 [Mycena galopus ATCC 62051]|nr:hypothetical protein K438DRAFT_1778311 [Mycena galopus ATCC 62051]
MTEAPLVSQVARGGLVPKQNSGMNDRLDPKVYESDAPAQHRMSEDMKDLEVKVQKRRNALELTPLGYAQRPKQLAKFGSSLRDRYKMLQDMKDLEAALQTYQKLVDLTPLDDSKRLGNPQDLETALQLNQAALECTPPGHERRAVQLQAFALSLRNRYTCLPGNLNDLEAALKAHREALALTPLGHHKRPGQPQRFAWSLGDQYDRLGYLKDLETALQSRSLLARFIMLGDLKDVNAALDADHEAPSLTPPGNAERAARLEGLGATLRARYGRVEDPKDLEAMVQAHQEAVTLTPVGHSERSTRLESLATPLIDKYRTFRDLADLEAALQNKREALDRTRTRIAPSATLYGYGYRRIVYRKDKCAINPPRVGARRNPSRISMKNFECATHRHRDGFKTTAATFQEGKFNAAAEGAFQGRNALVVKFLGQESNNFTPNSCISRT